MRTLANVAGFQINWFASVLGAAAGRPWLGLLTVTLLVAAHMLFPPVPRSGAAKLLAGAAAMGLAGEWLLLHVLAVVGYPPQVWLGAEPVPLWMIGLWIGFAATLHLSLSWLQGRYLAAALAGAVAGPLSYWGGAKLGAITLHPEPLAWIAGIGLLWAVATPLLAALAEATRS